MTPRDLRVVIAPDSFKGSAKAADAAAAIADGWRSVRAGDRLVLMPQADGGEGTLDAIEESVPGSVRRSAGMVTGPDGRTVPGEWLELPGRVAVIELAQMSGLPLMGALDPLGASTRGLGEVIGAALDSGASRLVIALGGSASTDGGVGALSALGLEAGDGIIRRDHLRRPPAGGVTLLTDVSAPLLGPTGAAAVFAPQKGATPAQVATLESALTRLANLAGGDPVAPGSGAAGGTAYGFATFWGATIEPGAEYVARLTGLHEALADADVLLTGEGRFDAQSLAGKIVGHLIDEAGRRGLPVGIIAGRVSAPLEGWAASLTHLAGSVDAALLEPERWLRVAGARAAAHFGNRDA